MTETKSVSRKVESVLYAIVYALSVIGQGTIVEGAPLSRLSNKPLTKPIESFAPRYWNI
tara:strand:+ start:444 stop:620 length:177 start_codon:yes stop_codon:yes gene_type:complete